MLKNKFLYSLLVIFLFINIIEAQNISKSGTTAASFLEIGVGAKALGMGSAFVSVANDASSLYWNVSGIASSDKFRFLVSHTNWIADTKFDFAGLLIPLADIGTVGFSFTSLSMSDMKVRTVELPEGTGEFFSSGDIAIAVSYAIKLTDRFLIGLTAKYIQQSIWHMNAKGFGIDFGVLFHTDLLNGMTIGAEIRNFGTPITMSGRDSRYFIRIDPSKQGSNDQIPTNIQMDSWDLPLAIQLGVSTNVINTENYKLNIAIDALHPNNNYESLNVGAELNFYKFLFIRTGYRSLFLKDGEGGFSFGFGITSQPLFSNSLVKIDYAFGNFGRLQNIHTFTVDISF